ncbi:tetratricopeptide repeat protein 23 isoform X3 [Myotis myotis]|uniref:tetratricopeptide repeat protein 23 isoform X3 n=1 Tax=Myotis myotis TaxID=51298 RepID=UPI001747E773|nr:tetratricopeptide repeat protein 23 isoform X3 [Myotis myotis]
MQESQETHISKYLDEIVAAVSVTPRKKFASRLPHSVLFQPPREQLQLCEEKAKFYSSRHEYKQAIQELVRCVALTRICYGSCHWKLAEAYVNLAQGYLQLKGTSLQAKHHAEKAREILTNSIVPSCDDNTAVFRCSVELFHTLGRALLSLQKFKEAAENLAKAERLSQELLRCGRIVKEEWIETQARIKLSFARMYRGRRKSKEALPYYQEALEHTESSKGEKSLECVPVLRELAGAERALRLHDASINHFLQRATSILRESLEAKVGAFGDLSPEVAETYRLLSGADLAQGNHSGAHKKLNKLSWRKMMVACSMTVARGWSRVVGESRGVAKDRELTALGNAECLQIQTLLYGPQDRRTLATQQALDVLSKAPEMATVKLRSAPRARPTFCTGVAQHAAPRRARPHVAD